MNEEMEIFDDRNAHHYVVVGDFDRIEYVATLPSETAAAVDDLVRDLTAARRRFRDKPKG